MQKKLIHIVFSLVLSLSILTPSVVNLLDGVQKHQLISDLGDDENKTEEYKTDFEEKNLILPENLSQNLPLKKQKNKITNSYIPGCSDLELKIILPPPENII